MTELTSSSLMSSSNACDKTIKICRKSEPLHNRDKYTINTLYTVGVAHATTTLTYPANQYMHVHVHHACRCLFVIMFSLLTPIIMDTIQCICTWSFANNQIG